MKKMTKSIQGFFDFRRVLPATFIILLLFGLIMSGQSWGQTFCSPTGNEELATDRDHDKPGEPVFISGKGYAPFCDVKLQVTVNEIVLDTMTTQTDSNGEFLLSFPVDITSGVYKIDVMGGDPGEIWTSVTFTTGGYIETDMPHYAPGNRVTITGGNWQPGEVVQIVLHEIDGPGPDVVLTAAADSAGNIINDEFFTNEGDLRITFRATATGMVSGYVSEVEFKDSLVATSRATGNWSADSTWSTTRSGTISRTNGSTLVTGSSTKFLTELAVGDTITTTADALFAPAGTTVASITDDTHLTLSAAATSTAANFTWKARKAPASTDDVIIQRVTGGQNLVVTLDQSTACNTLLINGSGPATGGSGTLTFAGNQTLTVAGAVTITSGAGSNGGTANLNINAGTLDAGSLNASGVNSGTITLTTGTLDIAGDALLQAGGSTGSSFTLNVSAGQLIVDGTVTINGGGAGGVNTRLWIGSGTATIGGNLVNTAGAGTKALTFQGAGTANIGGNLGSGLTLTNYTTAPGSTVNFNGSSASTIAAYTFQNLTINKSGAGVATLSGAAIVNGPLSVVSGTFSHGASLNVTANGGVSVSLGATYKDVGTGDLLLGAAGVSNEGTIQLNGNGTACGQADAILIDSTANGVQRPWSGSGAFDIQDVTVQDQGGSALITAVSSTSTGNNSANWTFTSGCVQSTTTAVASNSPGNTSTYGDSVTFTATVTASGSPVTTGSVTFIEGGTCASPGTILQAATAVNGSGVVTYTTSGLTPPSHTIIACYGGTAVYNSSNGSVTQTVNNATATVVLSNLTQTYTGSPLTPTATTDPVGLTIDWTGAPQTNAGSYPVTATVNDPNYQGSASGTFVINKAEATVSVSGYTGVYDAAAHGASGTATGVGGTDLSAGLNFGASYTDVPGGTAHWTFTGGTNYNDQSGDVAIVINKADATVSVSGYTGVYDGNPHGASGTATGVGGTDLSAGLNLGATYTDVPGGTAHWTFTGGTNYNDQSGDVAIVIDKAEATVLVSGYTGVYDAAAHGASGTATGVGGTDLSAGLNLGATFTDVPGGTAHWTFTGGTNYNDQSGDVAIVIDKAPTVTTVTATNYIYNGAQTLGETASVSGPGLLAQVTPVIYTGTSSLGVAYGPTTTAPTNPGNYTATASYPGGDNYLPSSGSSNFTITIVDSNGDGIPDFLSCTTLPQSRVVYKSGTIVGTMLAAVLPASRLHTSLQAAVIAAADNDVIGMYASTTENVVIGDFTGSGGKDLRIVGCGQKITAAITSKPVITIEVSAGKNDGDTGAGEADIHVDDVNVLKGTFGFLLQTSKGNGNNTSTLLKSIRSDSNSQYGIQIQGNGNEVRGANSIGTNTKGGIQILNGNNNLLRSNRVASNKGPGIDVTGSANTIIDSSIGDKGVGNSGIGLNINGVGNIVHDNNVFANTGLGIKVTGNDNEVYKNDVGDSGKGNGGGGIYVMGDNNLLGKDLSENDIFANKGIGMQVIGNANKISKNDVGEKGKGNTLDGINVKGYGNTIDENNVFANGGDGIDVWGGTSSKPNVISKNDVGDRGKGNLCNGILVGGFGADAGNGTAAPVEIDSNTVMSNKLNGIKVGTAGHQLGNNTSGGAGSYASGGQANGQCAFSVVIGNFNATGNKANNVDIAGAMDSDFPTGCK
jgi:parallel beta-helix repeat protein